MFNNPVLKLALGCILLLVLPMVVIGQAPSTQPPAKSTNTLVSGIVLTTYDAPLGQEVEVILHCGWTEIARLTTRGGMFSMNLEGIAAPTDTITIGIEPGPRQSSKVNDAPPSPEAAHAADSIANLYTFSPTLFSPLSHGGTILKVALADAQNINLNIFQHLPIVTLTEWGDGAPYFPLWQNPFAVTDISAFLITVEIMPVTPPPSNLRTQDRSCTR
jgi:hypothetical protein